MKQTSPCPKCGKKAGWFTTSVTSITFLPSGNVANGWPRKKAYNNFKEKKFCRSCAGEIQEVIE